MNPRGDDSSDGNGGDPSSSSSESSGSEPPASEEHAYEATQNAFHVTREGKLQGGMATLNLMEIFHPSGHWLD